MVRTGKNYGGGGVRGGLASQVTDLYSTMIDLYPPNAHVQLYRTTHEEIPLHREKAFQF